jgi:glycosyltransferase involved in cell wall biosynthesis
MNILVVTRYFYPRLGGGELILWQILKGLVKRGHKPYVITSKYSSSAEFELIDGIKIYRPFDGADSMLKGGLFSLRLNSYLNSFLKKTPMDVIVNGAYSCTLPACYAARKNRIPSVTYVTYYYGRTWFRLVNPFMALFNCLFPIVTLYFAKSDIICCPSKMIIEKLRHFSSSKFLVIPSPIDTAEISRVNGSMLASEIKTGLAIKSDEKFLVFVGRLSPEKNICKLIETLQHSEVNYKLVVVGEGPERLKIEKLIERFRMSGKVILLGRKSHEETLATMKAADVLILPSVTEVFPTVVLEALSMEKPVISTKVGGVSEMVSSNLHLIDKLDEIDEILKNNLISRSDPDMINRYSIENIVCSFEDMLEQASKQ